MPTLVFARGTSQIVSQVGDFRVSIEQPDRYKTRMAVIKPRPNNIGIPFGKKVLSRNPPDCRLSRELTAMPMPWPAWTLQLAQTS